MLAVVARGLRDLKDQVVFVGGAVVDLYITDPSGDPVRATDDVDCVVGITSRPEYGVLEEKLRGLGFTHPLDDPDAPICRWRFSGILVDVMPMEGDVLGFSNRWYPEGIANAQRARLEDGTEVSYLSLPYFVASKIEAFFGRGKGDFYGSPDIEDIAAVADRAEDFAEKMASAPESVRTYLEEKLRELLENDVFVQSIQGHLGTQAGQGRIDRTLRALRSLVRK